MQWKIELLLLLLHAICCVAVWLGIRTQVLKVKKYLMFPVIFVPFWGVLCVLLLHFQICGGADNVRQSGVEKLKVKEELYKNIFVTQDASEQVVPLEDALLLNQPGVRRELIMDVLNDDPGEYMELLKKARMNDDVEVVHYAITAMVELSKDYDYRLQQIERRYARQPEDPAVLAEYCDFLEEYGAAAAASVHPASAKAPGAKTKAPYGNMPDRKSSEAEGVRGGIQGAAVYAKALVSQRRILDFICEILCGAEAWAGAGTGVSRDETGAYLSVIKRKGGVGSLAGCIKAIREFRFKWMIIVLFIFLMMGAVLYAERSGIRYQEMARQISYMEPERVVTEKEAVKTWKTTCLVLTDSTQEASMQALPDFERMFMDMRVGIEVVDVSSQALPDFSAYETVVVLLTDLSPLKEEVLALASWVEQGGSAMFALTLQKNTYVSLIEQKLGILSSGYDNVLVDSIYFEPDFLLGGGVSYDVTDGYDSAWEVELGEQAKVCARVKDAAGTPLIWETDYGKGKFVVDNFGLYEKATRGLFAASYSLLTDVGVYPVINGSVFYLDDFPSPVPSGDGKYVKRDYGTSIQDFYTNIWWPDMLALADEHGVRYTGVIIENYEDDTDGTVKATTDTERFQYFGNMLLHRGGELGYHGYNHQPLSLSDTDYGDVLPYKTWDSVDAMDRAVTELISFGTEMFPGTTMSVYVPPSNVLSEEGRALLASKYPQIRTIASNYFPGEFAYVQEFEVADDGIVEQPRIISGCIIDSYMQMAALSELNMHFVNTHFMNPDDLLDEDRGAALGWETLKNRLDEYMTWLDTSAPSLRNLTGSELSGAIQRYGGLTVEKKITDQEIRLQLGNLYDTAYLFVRVNEGTPGDVTGGSLTHLTGKLYLLCADSPEVVIQVEK